MNRRRFIRLSIIAAGSILGISAYSNFRKDSLNQKSFIKNKSSEFPIPPLAKYKIINGKKIFDLTVQKGEKNFLGNFKTPTYGINGDFLGPTIKVTNQDKLEINVTNKLDENTTLHWHGLHIDGKYDGGPHQVISINDTWTAKLNINQRASTAWYHPHLIGRTGYQVYKGIAGLFIIDDENSKKFPNEYGVDDIPLVIQDKRFNNNGELSYISSMHDKMMGITGNYIFINGVLSPVFNPKKSQTRFRILNGSNSRIYMLGFEDEREFSLIATDGGFLEKPLKMTRMVLAPGERAEIVVKVMGDERISLVDYLSKSYLLDIQSKSTLEKSKPLPQITSNPFHITPSNNEVIRQFDLNMGMGTATINGKTMDMDRIDEHVPINRSEIWRITNIGGMMSMAHPFHVHGCSFEIISRNGQSPYIFESGLKDTVLVNKGEIIDIRVIFNDKADKNNPYMYHCHNLEHEDLGMMGQFTVS
jgi:FtsP/CotA-like multicopper oxidase with cupredoxin domain